MAALKLQRRSFLKGLGGVSLALPMLEAMLDSNGAAYAAGAPIPKRYVYLYGNHSLGFGYNDPAKNSYCRQEPRDMFVPNTVGANYDLKTALAPLGTYGVKDLVSVVSGLKIPYTLSGSETVAKGGVSNVFHGPVDWVGLTGCGVGHGSGPSADQVIAQTIAGGTIFKSLNYGVMPVSYWIDNYDNGQTRSVGLDGKFIPEIRSPRVAYQQLMDKIAIIDATAKAERDLLMAQRKSVLDLVLGTSTKLMPKLGMTDRMRLQRHFDEVRSLETRIEAVEVTCQSLPIPTDPSIGDTVVVAGNGTNDYKGQWDQTGWSSEDKRAELFTDLIAMAFRCDLTRVVTLNMGGNNISAWTLLGARSDVHRLTHFGSSLSESGSTLLLSKWMAAYDIKVYASLVSKLRDMMNDCVVVYGMEGGVGRSMEAPDAAEQPKAHSSENMAMLIAGTSGGLRGGVHVQAPSGVNHPVNVYVSAMKAAGLTQNTLGEVTGVIPGLFA